MKTKYVKVPVSERLPEKEGKYQCITKSGNFKYVSFSGVFIYEPFYEEEELEYWLEEKEDHSEEMLFLLEDVKNKFKPSLSHPLEEVQEEFINQIEQLINKVKDNGTRI
ncbi:hypothetical protein PF438_04065 [Elizabethkingia meningoseptica]|uniref:hypothetical protein n=1 Tax=Elizabethkingia meningoseptica TaxID=238 RepID=UPI0022F1C5AE|nr:hypothetical protein [Elizabethkingia meningoseptica]EJK5330551.1 hypothetical protein [Elizabethkingia meningoseptica]WBS75667.1 hypothetical protein PF438_04065 [Elizabethkingia meningoseptica]